MAIIQSLAEPPGPHTPGAKWGIMDICLEIIVNPATHTLTDSDKHARRLKAGDILSVLDIDEQTDKISQGNYQPKNVLSSPRTGFLYLNNAPSKSLKAFQLQLQRSETPVLPDEPADPNTPSPHHLVKIGSKANCQFDLESLSTEDQNSLETNRFINLNWGQFRSQCNQKQQDRVLQDSDIKEPGDN